MFMMRIVWVYLLMVLLLAACAQKPGEHHGKVYCPGCGAEVEALFEKRY